MMDRQIHLDRSVMSMQNRIPDSELFIRRMLVLVLQEMLVWMQLKVSGYGLLIRMTALILILKFQIQRC